MKENLNSSGNHFKSENLLTNVISERLHLLKTELDITQKDLQHLLGVSSPSFMALYHGKKSCRLPWEAVKRLTQIDVNLIPFLIGETIEFSVNRTKVQTILSHSTK